jgi:hypothetical protein
MIVVDDALDALADDEVALTTHIAAMHEHVTIARVPGHPDQARTLRRIERNHDAS